MRAFTLTGTTTVPNNAEGGYYALIKATFISTTIPLDAEKVDIKGSSIDLAKSSYSLDSFNCSIQPK